MAGRTGTHTNPVFILIATFCFAAATVAQDPVSTVPTQSPSAMAEPASQQASPIPEEMSIMVPAGTRIPVVLSYPISTKSTQSGDDLHVQTTAPVVVSDQVVIPAGTFIQGTVDKLSRQGGRAEVRLRAAQLIFSNGYIAAITGRTILMGDEGTAWLNPSGRTKTGALLAPVIGTGIGAAIGSAVHTTQSASLGGQTITSSTAKGIAIGSAAGLAAGAAVSVFFLLHSRQFDVPEGAPMEMTLQEPLSLTRDEIADATEASEENPTTTRHPAPVPLRPKAAPAPHQTCFTPGIPGTPPTVFPGTPGPNGIPGPPTIIPGRPAIPGTPYPCP